MIAPLFKTGVFGDVGFVIAAVAVGFGFGFALERGGLADARKLTAQFYLRDFTVLQAMFTAIVVAMLGIFALALVGVLDLNLLYIAPTRVWPMIVGATLVGLGFAIGGYCPGTTLVAAAAGKLDAVAFLVGALLGITVFAELAGVLAEFARSGTLAAPATLDSWLGVNPGIIVLLIVIMAAVVFTVVERYVRSTRDS